MEISPVHHGSVRLNALEGILLQYWRIIHVGFYVKI